MGAREDAHDNEVAPLMAQIIAVCKKHDIPMLATFQYSEPGDNASWCTTMLPGTDEAEELTRLKNQWNAVRLGPPLIAMTITTVKS